MGLMAEMKESVEREAKRYKCFYDYKNPNEVMSPECKYKPYPSVSISLCVVAMQCSRPVR